MPLFEYRCAGCDHQFELLVRESTKLECPKCASTQLAKQLSVFAVSVPSGGSSRDFGPAPLGRGSLGEGGCGSCGDPRGPGSCNNN